MTIFQTSLFAGCRRRMIFGLLDQVIMSGLMSCVREIPLAFF